MATEDSEKTAPARSGVSKNKAAEPETTEAVIEAPGTPVQGGEQDAPEIPDMPVAQLIEHASVYLGHSSWTAAGALHEHPADEMMSIDAAKAAIEQWRTAPPPSPDSEE